MDHETDMTLTGRLYLVSEGVARIAGPYVDDSPGVYIFATDAAEALDVAADIDQLQAID